jgi:hypothetical protein
LIITSHFIKYYPNITSQILAPILIKAVQEKDHLMFRKLLPFADPIPVLKYLLSLLSDSSLKILRKHSLVGLYQKLLKSPHLSLRNHILYEYYVGENI